MTSGRSDLVDLELPEFRRASTEKAWAFKNLKDVVVWIAKSQAEYEDGTLTLPEWLAAEKELV